MRVQEALHDPPKGYFVVVPQREGEDPVDLVSLVAVLWESWKLVAVVVVLCAAIAAAISLQMQKIYTAQALVMPSAKGSGNGVGGAMRNQFGGLAALAGIDLGASGAQKEEALAVLNSPGFAREFIRQENLMPVLFAERWNSATGKWRADSRPPTEEAAVKKFTTTVRMVADDRKSGVITISVKWRNPQLAAKWANKMVEMVNERLRSEAILNSESSIQFLDQELAKTDVVEMREVIYGLIRDQVSNAMLANVQRDYAFHFIDRAVAPQTRTSPKRVLITIGGAAFGFFCAIFYVFLRRRLRESKQVPPVDG